MAYRDIVVVGFSAGGVEKFVELVRDLPASFPAAIAVVHHFPPSLPSSLPAILRRSSRLDVCEVEDDGVVLAPGRVFVSVPDRHLVVRRRSFGASRGPRENGYRPSIDVLFRTAAESHGAGVIAVLMSGNLDDGVSGLTVVRRRGGVTVVQDPSDALFSGMPEAAIARGAADLVVPSAAIAETLVRLCSEPGAPAAVSAPAEAAGQPPEPGDAGASVLLEQIDRQGLPSGYTCPECGGALWETRNGETVRYICHVGHGFSEDGLISAQSQSTEAALWAAVRALQERSAMCRRIAGRMRRRGAQRVANEMERQSREAEARAALIRHTLLERPESGVGSAATRPGPGER